MFAEGCEKKEGTEAERRKKRGGMEVESSKRRGKERWIFLRYYI